MKILFLGDVVGNPGRTLVARRLPEIRAELGLDLVFGNGENSSGGVGISVKTANELRNAGFDVVTTGNHVWKQRDIHAFIDKEEATWLLRPANFPEGAPGRGLGLYATGSGTPYAVINLMGRTYLDHIDCPFKKADALLSQVPEHVRLIFVDFHAEATSEKKALAFYLDGRVTAVVGTHTHVQTNDAQILPKGTAYLTDLGMCGPSVSILGMDPTIIVRRFMRALPERFELASGPASLEGALIEVDETTGQALSIQAWKD